jgi:aminoglycoside 6'-N-acetyltransferase
MISTGMREVPPFASKLPDRAIDDADDPALTLRALREQDLPLIREWLHEGHVRRWYGPPDREVAHIAAHIDDPCVSPFLAIESGRPIGYLQVYHANADPYWAEIDVPRETFGSDLFIGERDAAGRGLGPRLLGLVRKRLFRWPEVVRLHIDVDPANTIARRAYEKAGFRPVGAIDTPDGRALYMIIDRGA